MTSTRGGDPVNLIPLPLSRKEGVLLRGAIARHGRIPIPLEKGREPAPGGTWKKELWGATRIPTPLEEWREIHPGARGAGAQAVDSSSDPAPRKHRGRRDVEAVPLCAITRVVAAVKAAWADPNPIQVVQGFAHKVRSSGWGKDVRTNASGDTWSSPQTPE